MAHVSKLEKDPLKKMIIQNLLRFSPLLEYLPFTPVQALTSTVNRWTALPTVQWRAINGEYTSSSGDVEPVSESVYVFGGEIEIDRVYDKIKASLIQDPEKLQIDMMTQAMAYELTDKVINGNHAVDVNTFNGLTQRISNMPSRQLVNVTTASGTALDPTASAGNARLFIDRWEQACYRANKGAVNVILANEGMQWGLGRVLRYAGVNGGPLLDTAKDQFDREILTYKGAPILDAGFKADQSTEVITDTETAADAGSDATSVYFIPFDEMQGIQGIELTGGLEVFPGKKNKSTVNVTTVEWGVGLAGYGSYGPTRLWNIEAPGSWT
jgi:hypothetical protein